MPFPWRKFASSKTYIDILTKGEFNAHKNGQRFFFVEFDKSNGWIFMQVDEQTNCTVSTYCVLWKWTESDVCRKKKTGKHFEMNYWSLVSRRRQYWPEIHQIQLVIMDTIVYSSTTLCRLSHRLCTMYHNLRFCLRNGFELDFEAMRSKEMLHYSQIQCSNMHINSCSFMQNQKLYPSPASCVVMRKARVWKRARDCASPIVICMGHHVFASCDCK